MNIHLIENTPMKLLLEPVGFYLDEFSIEKMEIPAGYAFDGLSIPRLLQGLVNMNLTQNIKAGLKHDFDFSELSDVGFFEANKRLFNNLKATFLAKATIWIGVSIFGYFSYKKDSNYMAYRKQIMKARVANKLPKNLIKKKKL